jgi:hypothetical protein
MDLLCILLHQFEGRRSPLGITRIELSAGQVRHLANKLGIEKASVSGLSLIRLGLKRDESS